MQKAVARASGVVVKDNPQLLKRAIAREKSKKKKSAKTWFVLSPFTQQLARSRARVLAQERSQATSGERQDRAFAKARGQHRCSRGEKDEQEAQGALRVLSASTSHVSCLKSAPGFKSGARKFLN